MDSTKLVVSLDEAAECGESSVGGKGSKLGLLIRAGYRVPPGYCVTVRGYQSFVRAGRLGATIQMELGRKPLADMRWEEIWDAALRIRRAFLSSPIPEPLAEEILRESARLEGALAVRSSAPGEDSAARSYAGLHESLVGVARGQALLDAVRIVWASLWSDAALLYRRELDLDPHRSAMAVVVQQVVAGDVSGVGFGRDPRDARMDLEVVEAVPGPCGDLVDGLVDPDQWIMKRSSGEIVKWTPGRREGSAEPEPILQRDDLDLLHRTLRSVESILGWAPDLEWTGRRDAFTLLQARPVTAPGKGESGDDRDWYLSLRPGTAKLKALAVKVTQDLIPRLEEEGRRLSGENIDALSDEALAGAIEDRRDVMDEWKKIYWDEFIPFAHGVRQLAVYYNDAVKPEDPYQFVGLLRSQPMIATRRNEAIAALARRVRADRSLGDVLRGLNLSVGTSGAGLWREMEEKIRKAPGGREFLEELGRVLRDFMDVAHGSERLAERPDLVLHSVVELATTAGDTSSGAQTVRHHTGSAKELEDRLLEAVGEGRKDEALDILEIARVSWRLRDDDNILVGRLDEQLLRALQIAASRLRSAGRLDPASRVGPGHAAVLAGALRDPKGPKVSLPEVTERGSGRSLRSAGRKARQLTGQPAAPGLATGMARIVRGVDDFGKFKSGDVLVCDSIQPTMSHLVPLARAIAERRGGMLIHGAIIARELGIPCVNGLTEVVELVEDGELVTVDGYLGIVTIGPPELDAELARAVGASGGRPPS